MRVLLVCDFYPPQTGGMESHVRALALGLKQAGHEPFVATTEVEESEEVRDGIPVFRFRGLYGRMSFAFSRGDRRYPPPAIDPELTVKLHALITRVQPDVVHAHGWVLYSALAANTVHKVPFVFTMHDYGHFCAKRTLLRGDAVCGSGRGAGCVSCATAEYGNAKAFLTFAGTGLGIRQLGGVDAFISVSRFVANASKPYLPGRPLRVIPNFIDPVRFAGERDREAGTQLPPTFALYVGVLAPLKGVDDLIAAFKLARRHGTVPADTELLLLGREHPSARYENDPQERISVMYNPPRGLVVEAIHRCACLAVPSKWHDPCPTTVLEGLAAGRRIIGTRSGGIPELLEEVEGAQIVPPGNPEALARALGNLFEGPDGVTVAQEEVSLLPPGYTPLAPPRVVAQTLEVYAAAIESRASGKARRAS